MMEVSPQQVFERLTIRAQGDPLVAEILRTAALEAALEMQQQQLDVPEDNTEEGSDPEVD